MKAKSIFTFSTLLIIINSFSQNSTIELKFTAINNTTYQILDSVKVMNRNQGCDTVVYFPDTILKLDFPVDIRDYAYRTKGFRIEQNFPNPVIMYTTILIYVPQADNVKINLFDIRGQHVKSMDIYLKKGYHKFKFVPDKKTFYVFTAIWNGITQSIKISANTNTYSDQCHLTYEGFNTDNPNLRSGTINDGFIYSWGDSLLMIGYSGILETSIPGSPITDETYTFQFATNIPCPGMPTVTYEEQVYNTIQIFSQCWMKENLNVGTMIPGTQDMTNNSIIEKYCYNNKTDSCTKYGGLYKWDEMMQYTVLQGAQGICPQGWHIPTDEEWKTLEGAVDSQYGIGDQIWDEIGYRGYDAGKNLRTTSGWKWPGYPGSDLFGFSGLPGGHFDQGFFNLIGENGDWWTSTNSSNNEAFKHMLFSLSYAVNRMYNYTDYGFSVRCLKDY
jgi:uncharacterized protein (TIGR02145 family)